MFPERTFVYNYGVSADILLNESEKTMWFSVSLFWDHYKGVVHFKDIDVIDDKDFACLR